MLLGRNMELQVKVNPLWEGAFDTESFVQYSVNSIMHAVHAIHVPKVES